MRNEKLEQAQLQAEINFLKAEIQNLFRQERELETRRHKCEERLEKILDEQAIKRAKGEQ